ncbi:hypothetical protein [Wolbachia endosymbiont (group A) of Colletes cunicularius]
MPFLFSFNPEFTLRKVLPSFWPNINSAIDFVFQLSGKSYFG